MASEPPLGLIDPPVESVTLWTLTCPGKRVARAIMVHHWSVCTLTFWLGSEAQVTADFSRPHDARQLGEQIRARLLAEGWSQPH